MTSPLVAETSYLPADRFPGLEAVDFTRVRLYDTLTDALRRAAGARP